MDVEISTLPALFPENWSRQKNGISSSPSFPPTLTPCCKWLSQLLCPHTSATRECQRCSCCTAALLPVSQWWLTKPYRAYYFIELTSSSPALPKFREIFLFTVKKLLQLIPVSNGKQGLSISLFLPSGKICLPKVDLYATFIIQSKVSIQSISHQHWIQTHNGPWTLPCRHNEVSFFPRHFAKSHISFVFPFIHSFNKYLWSTYHVPNTRLSVQDIIPNKTSISPVFTEPSF